MRFLTIAAIGAACGILMIALGFDFRIGFPRPLVLLSAPEAYLPAAICGAGLALWFENLVN
ncbi:MAG: hypothetical protein AB7O60_09265 [Variibacter sp.]